MTKLFYDHLIIIEEIASVLTEHKLSASEQEKILELIDQTMHQEILSSILTLLPKDHHETFLIHLHATPSDKKILEFLSEKSGVNVEKEILKTADKVKRRVLIEINSAKHPHE